MDLKTMTVEQLKALAYDQIIILEQTQTNIRLINQEIAERAKTKEERGTN